MGVVQQVSDRVLLCLEPVRLLLFGVSAALGQEQPGAVRAWPIAPGQDREVNLNESGHLTFGQSLP